MRVYGSLRDTLVSSRSEPRYSTKAGGEVGEEKGSVTSLCYSEDRAEVLAGTADGNSYRLTTASLNTLLLSETHSAAVTDVAYASKVSERFCTASADGTLRIWDASDYTVVVRALVVDGGTPNCVALSLDTIISG